MSVVVLGMEMPARCGKCDFWNEITFCAVTGANIREFIEKRTRADDCPLRPLPEKHGELIDRDALLSAKWDWCDAEEAIRNATAIVEAEGENDA